jgi:hypothetical protein
MDEDTRQHLEAMEARLMSRITGAQEALIERIRTVEATVAGQTTAIAGLTAGVAALTEIARSTNTLIGTLAGLMTDVGRRVTDLEKK